VDLYDVVLADCPARLTSEQISELFHAGRLTRHDPCKLVQNPTWRTVDEVFPLLKYGASAAVGETPPSPRVGPTPNALVSTAAITVAVVVAVTYLVARQSSPALTTVFPKNRTIVAHNGTTVRLSASNAYSAAPVPTAVAQQPPVVSRLSVPNHTAASTSAPGASTTRSERAAGAARFDARVASYNAAMELARRDRHALEEKAAAAERSRLERDKRVAERKRLAGTDILIRLDKFVPIDVGGSRVTIKIQDTGIATFNLWIDSSAHRSVVKQQGLSHTGADETLIYRNGRASLYYVSAISGEQNHCILRVRER
jgi:hypothetical protein